MDEMADNRIESCDVLGWEWEMGLHDTIGETARRRGLDLRRLQIPREIIDPAVREVDAVRFFKLAHVDLAHATWKLAARRASGRGYTRILGRATPGYM